MSLTLSNLVYIRIVSHHWPKYPRVQAKPRPRWMDRSCRNQLHHRSLNESASPAKINPCSYPTHLVESKEIEASKLPVFSKRNLALKLSRGHPHEPTIKDLYPGFLRVKHKKGRSGRWMICKEPKQQEIQSSVQ